MTATSTEMAASTGRGSSTGGASTAWRRELRVGEDEIAEGWVGLAARVAWDRLRSFLKMA